MSQTTLTGGQTRIRAPKTSLSPNERRIWNLLRTSNRGWTEKQIANTFPDMTTVGNRLRELRKKGWTVSVKPRHDGEQLWYAVKEVKE